jgi:formamidopyrimidine-DNA glycosylase
MPELPEVETVVRDLRPLVVGRVIDAVRAGRHKLRTPWKPAWSNQVAGRRVDSIDRRGKWILARLAGGATLLLHLGMTGQLTVQDEQEPIADHTHLRFALNDGRELRFRDIRRFGSAELFVSPAEIDEHLNDRLGPEPFDLDPEYWHRELKGTARSVKAVLLDQTVLAGVGNIYADEALFRAGVHPGRRANTMTRAQSEALRRAIEAILTDAIAGRGSTIRDYVGGSGLKGQYQGAFAVYGRTGEPCPACGAKIVVARIAGRSSHHCRRCQK